LHFFDRSATSPCVSLGSWDAGGCWFDLESNFVVGEWTYVSLDINAPDYSWGDYEGSDFSYIDSLGIGFDNGGVFLIDHWTVSTTPEEGMLAEPAPAYTEGTIGSNQTFYETDADVTLSAKGTAGETPGYTWDFDGGALPANATADGAYLSIEGLDAGNLGTYTCTWDDGVVEEKGTQVASLTLGSLEAAGSVPAVNYLGLVILAILSALVGAAVIRRQTA
jgi:hypothetical protein